MVNPSYRGNQNPAVLYAARKCKIKEIYSIGGPSAVLQLLLMEQKKLKLLIKLLDLEINLLLLPKKEVFGEIGIDGIAGPSEVTIVCDKISNPEWLASDLIGQAEHGKLLSVF